MSPSQGSLSILTNIFSSPQEAYKNIQQEYPILLPLFLIIGLNAILAILLFMNIDFEWYVDHMVEISAGEKSIAEQDQVRQGFSMMSASTMGILGAVTGAIGLVIIFCINALYFVIVSNITNDGFQFKQWLSFISWSSMPAIITALASIVMILTSSNGQIAPESLDVLSLNELFFGMDPVKGLGNILATTSITQFWIIALMTIGYSKWTEKSLGQSFFIVIIPTLIYFGVRLLML